MDKLLEIKEAAAFLSVSEMTIRRWTNSGKLKCFRIGGKRERRFRLSDLQELLQSNIEDIPLGFGGIKVPKSAHLSHFYSNEDESLDLGIPYVKEGLDRGELLLIVFPDKKIQKFLSGLEDQGIMVEVLQSQGILTTISGRSDFDAQTELMNDLLEKSQKFKGFRLLGDMVWTQDREWELSKVYALEKLTNEIRTGKESVFLCQYDITKFSADMAFMAMQTHNFTVYRDKLKPSPYFDLAKGWLPAM